MNTISSFFKSLGARAVRLPSKIKALGWKKLSAGAAAVILVLIAISLFTGGAPAKDVTEQGRTVTVASVSDLSQGAAPLSVVGTVKSQSQADVRTESSGEVTAVYRSLGDFVSAGTIIAELENSSERASLLSSQGGVDAAQAQLLKVRRGGREEQQAILQTNVTSAQNSLQNTKESTVNTITSAYAAVDEAVRRKADQMFSNPDSSSPDFTVQTAESQLANDAEIKRVRATTIITRESSAQATLTPEGDLDAEIRRTSAELRDIQSLFDSILGALNKAVPNQTLSATTIAGYKADATAARSSITAALSALTSARDTLTSKQAALDIARKTLEQGVSADEPDVAAAEAALKQAQGGLAQARASYERTIVRSPISGTINSLSLSRGDFVSPSAPAATIANNGALEVITYVTETDLPDLAVGAPVRIEGAVVGVITKIAPALDPVSKKIEVRIGVTSDTKLVNGQALTIELLRSQSTKPQTPTTAPSRITIPISALKVGTESTMVFTVEEDGTLVAHDVKLGQLLGDRVVIESGITSDMRIVVDARGLKAGDTVTVK